MYRVPRLSPDGKQVAVTLVDQQVDVWTVDIARKTLNRLTDSPSWDAYPLWEPGMRRMAFSSMRDGVASIYRQNLLTGVVEKLVSADHPIYPSSWSPDGKLLAYQEDHPQTELDIWVYSMESRSSELFLRTRYNESHAEFSPDGKWIAYHSSEAGDNRRSMSARTLDLTRDERSRHKADSCLDGARRASACIIASAAK